MNLLLLPSNLIRIEEEFILDDLRHAEHIHCVLKAKPGALIRCGVPNGNMGIAELLESTRTHARLRLLNLDTPPPNPSPIRLIVALPRPQSFKKTLHFLASAGIKQAIFLATDRVEKSYWSSDAVKPEQIRSELILGLEQGMDTVMPDVELRPSFRDFLNSGELASFAAHSVSLIAHPVHAENCPCGIASPVTLAIGPEGGFLPREVDSFTNAGFRCVTFGPHILRVEFAVAFLAGRLSS